MAEEGREAGADSVAGRGAENAANGFGYDCSTTGKGGEAGAGSVAGADAANASNGFDGGDTGAPPKNPALAAATSAALMVTLGVFSA